MKKSLVFISAGAEISSLIILSIYLGQKLDSHFSTKGLFLISFILISFVGWFVRLLQIIKKQQK